MSPLEVVAYAFSLASLLLLTHRQYVVGYIVGALDVIPWCFLAVAQWDAPGMLVLEGVYLAFNLWGLWRHRKDPLGHQHKRRKSPTDRLTGGTVTGTPLRTGRKASPQRTPRSMNSALPLSNEDLSALAAKLAPFLAQAGANAAAQPGPKEARTLPTNIDGNPEFSNVILSLDHLQDAYGDDGHIRNKMVFSTESSAEVIAKLLSYYQEPLSPNALARVLEITGKAAETEYNGGILVLYFDKGNPNDQRGPVVEVVLSTVTYDGLVQHPDFGKNSSLLASDALIRAVSNAIKHQKEKVGFIPLLTYLQISEATWDASSEAVAQEPADFSGRGEVFNETQAFTGSPHGDEASDAPNSVTGGQGFTG